MRSPVRLKEYKWQSYLLAAINSTEWQNRWEVEERLKAIMPPEAFNRGFERYWNKQRTVHSFACTVIGTSIRRLARNGYIERSIPVTKIAKNIGNYSLRLTPKGVKRRGRIYRYFCNDCFNTGLSTAKNQEYIMCGHCRRRHLTINKL